MNRVVIFLLLAGEVHGQAMPAWDTLYYQKFRSRLIVWIFQAFRNFDNQFEQFMTPDLERKSEHYYLAESNLVTGVEATYDKLSLAIGLRSVPPENREAKGRTEMFTGDFRFGGNKWNVDNGVRYFRGFYDANTRNYDSNFVNDGKYYQLPRFSNALFRSKFLYFTNHKRYSARSGSTSNYRQLKSAATWVLSANVNYNELSNDSSFFPAATRSYYRNYSEMNGLRVFGISANAGGAFTLVLWKALFFQALFIAGPEQQWRRYRYPERYARLSYISISGEARGSFGLNFRRWYFMSFSKNDFTFYNSSFVGLQNRSVSGGLILGVRINTKKTPEIYRRFQETWLYRNM